MKGYKAFKPGWKCKDFQYEIGKTYELPKDQTLAICECGFHFCANPIDVFGYYRFEDDILIAEVEAIGNIQQEGTKFCTDKIKIVKVFSRSELYSMVVDEKWNTGMSNIGMYNSGSFNMGSHNSGHNNIGGYNSGNFNTGYHNSGHSNTGYRNSGDYNSGNSNTGGSNSGSYNIGNGNSGNCNKGFENSGSYNRGDHNSGRYNNGHYNSGNYNGGYRNSGNYNSGYCNSGYWNSGNHNSGMFNTNEPTMRMFNHDSGITFTEFINGIDYNFYTLLENIQHKELADEDYDRIKALPNFDADIFELITGIDIKRGEKKCLN